ncbi:DUF4279 domain-containing protein [Nocardia sp. NPDC052566]|uniref:DUF4279 domain-containing protein n=1 Tax=Nocardia sp. NPDC052566 TaxID=3364330 RepID=UPI0037C6D7F9
MFVKTRQYSYFALKSDTVSAVDITARLLMEPDEVLVLGSRSPEHVIPRCHAWKVVRRSEESVDEQIQYLVDRLDPIRAELISLCATDDISAVMQVVRYFHDPEGAGTQHHSRPMGWHLPSSVLDFLVATRAGLDVDEYDLGYD